MQGPELNPSIENKAEASSVGSVQVETIIIFAVVLYKDILNI